MVIGLGGHEIIRETSYSFRPITIGVEQHTWYILVNFYKVTALLQKAKRKILDKCRE